MLVDTTPETQDINLESDIILTCFAFFSSSVRNNILNTEI